MKKFKRLLLSCHGKNKSSLHWLYNTHSVDPDELEKIFTYRDLQFYFEGTGFRTPERLLFFIRIPAALPGCIFPEQDKCALPSDRSALDGPDRFLPLEAFLLHILHPVIEELDKLYENDKKDCREKAHFEMQSAGNVLLKRNGIRYEPQTDSFLVRLNFHVPLLNALSVNAKSAVRAVRDLLQQMEAALDSIDQGKLKLYCQTYLDQLQIRSFLREHGLCAFIADGSILPREGETEKPLTDAVPFVSPKELAVTIPLSDGTKINGMGLPKGVTVITGGGYSGKSTLLDAIEAGIYNHTPGDGREYVLTDESALRCDAEDGRPVTNLDLSPFFHFLPESGLSTLNNFCTPHASGSVSQAANVVEATIGESSLLLMDEDKSATNFMIRDPLMRQIVKDEPIIPFTDRVCELYEQHGISTILVIGGSGEYLFHADRVLLMQDYVPEDITVQTQSLVRDRKSGADDIVIHSACSFPSARRLVPQETTKEFLYFQSVKTENEKKILLDEFSADITHLTALITDDQLNMLACVMERLLCDKQASDRELLPKLKSVINEIFEKSGRNMFDPSSAERFFEGIRPLDAFCCINRMRGVRFLSFRT